jgi:hypothetical protein
MLQDIQRVPSVRGHRRTPLIGKIRKKREDWKAVANYVFSISSVRIFLPRTSRYGATLFKSSVVKLTAMLPRWYDGERGCVSRVYCRICVSFIFPFGERMYTSYWKDNIFRSINLFRVKSPKRRSSRATVGPYSGIGSLKKSSSFTETLKEA